MTKANAKPDRSNTATIGFEAKLSLVADMDSACGCGGIIVQSEKFVESHSAYLGDFSICGQESKRSTRRFAIMNQALN